MQISAEIRYFWKDSPPTGVEAWFRGGEKHPFPTGEGELREDQYVRDATQGELGIKRRGKKAGLEVKGFVSPGRSALPAPFAGQVEVWGKWSFASLEPGAGSTVTIEKQRWLRKFETGGPKAQEMPIDVLPAEGCNVELTKLRVNDGDVWWTLGLEAFGTLWTVERNLGLAANALVERSPPVFSPQVTASYPSWLSTLFT
jgi:hypothetical protein